MEEKVLNEQYYLDNFIILITHVRELYDNLLTTEEKLFHHAFMQLPSDAQRLYVRLLSRKGPFFKINQLKYREIDIPTAVNDLHQSDFALLDEQNELEYILPYLTKKDLIELVQEVDMNLSLKKSDSKGQLLLLLEEVSDDIIWKTFQQLQWTFLSLLHREQFIIYKLLFFGNLYQDMHEFILEDLGVLKFEKYEIPTQNRYFNEREVVDGYLQITIIREELYKKMELKEVDAVIEYGQLLYPSKYHQHLKRKCENSCFQIGRFLEKFQLWDQCLAFYQYAHSVESRERQVRVLEKAQEDRQALSMIQQMIVSPQSQEEEYFALFFQDKLRKKLGLPYQKRKREQFLTDSISIQSSFYQQFNRIEEATLAYYNQLGHSGFYTENLIWSALFGLAFWEEIFQAVPHVFYNPFQRGPSDLFSKDFKVARNESLKKKVDYLQQTTLKEQILLNWELKYGTANYLVHWKKVKKEELEQVLDYVPQEKILLILEQMSLDLSSFRSGFPDLIIFGQEVGDYHLVEVKGPGDQMRPNQKSWFRFFNKHDIRVKVAKISIS